MTFRIKPVFLLAALIVGLFPLLPGCATTGSDRAEKATSKMEIVDADIRQTIAQLDETGVSIENLIKPGQSDIKGVFKTYSENVAKMERLGGKLIKHTDEMSSRGQDYFDEWKKQGATYTNPQIREISEQRRADLNNVFRQVSESSIGVRGSFIAYLKDIKEIQAFLSTDLTDKGIESITPVAQKAITDGVSLKNAVIPVLSALETAKRQMTQGGSN